MLNRLLLRRASLPPSSLRLLQLPTTTGTAPRRCFTAKARTVPPLKDVQFKLENGIATITLDRPRRMNALSEGMGESLLSLTDYLTALPSSEVRVCVLQGDSRAFSTGRDLKASKEHKTQAQRDYYIHLALQSVLNVLKLPMPVLAAMQGYSFGWGVELAMACDIRVATPDATLCLPETSLGIFPGAGGVVLLRELVSPAIAKELIYTAKRITGQEALGLGVVNHVDEDAVGKAMAIACRISCNGPLGVRGAKAVIDGCQNLEQSKAMDLAARLRRPLSETQDFKEALDAFEEKRSPVFHGR